MQINTLKIKETRKKKKIIGRGGKKGTYSGKGNKGQKARSGCKINPLFEGGRSTLIDHMKKKRGFTSLADKAVVVRLDELDENFQETDVISRELLMNKGFIRKSQVASRVKILGNSEVKTKFTIAKDVMISAAAKKIIEAAGGKVE